MTKINLPSADTSRLASLCESVDEAISSNLPFSRWHSIRRPLARLAVEVIRIAVAEAKRQMAEEARGRST